jgi:hypothetical protein
VARENTIETMRDKVDPEVVAQGQYDATFVKSEAFALDLSQYVTTRAIGYSSVVSMQDAYGRDVAVPTPGGGSLTGVELGMSPESLSINSAKVINRYQTLTRWVEEHWGDEIDQVSFSGSSFGFVTPYGYVLTPARRNAGSFKELQHLINIFRLNGSVIQTEDIVGTGVAAREFYTPLQRSVYKTLLKHPRAGILKSRNYVKVDFDFATFFGHFESFNAEKVVWK